VNLAESTRYWARWRPHHPALFFQEDLQTWGELDALSDEFAAGLAAQGVLKGDRVGLLMTNRLELPALTLAILKLGAICVPLNFRLLASEITPLVADSGAQLVITEAALEPLLAPSSSEPGVRLFSAGSTGLPDLAVLREHGPTPPLVPIDVHDPAFICYTSGTTGTQKGALLTHHSITTPAMSQILTYGVTYEDRTLAVAPLVYTGVMISMFMQMVVVPGATLVLEPEFDPDACLELFERRRISTIAMVPVIWERMAASPDFATRDLSSLKMAQAGGGPVSLELLKAYQAKGVHMVQGYGMTETSGHIASLNADQAESRIGSSGLPVAGTQVKVVDEEGQTCPPGEVGEILIKGDHVMREYWGKPDLTAEAIVDSWLQSGDLGFQDEEGFLTIVDRKKDMLISGGLNVYPAEIEIALAGIEGVTDLGVIGVPDATWGEVPMVLFSTDRDAADVATEIESAARQQLAGFKRPRYALDLGEALPRTFSGKLAKAELRKRFPDVPEGVHRLRTSSREAAAAD